MDFHGFVSPVCTIHGLERSLPIPTSTATTESRGHGPRAWRGRDPLTTEVPRNQVTPLMNGTPAPTAEPRPQVTVSEELRVAAWSRGQALA